MKYTGPKARLCRRQGANLFGSDKYDRILQRKPYGPGKGPRARRGKRSEYGTQLAEKQKLRDTFMVSEKQFFNYFVKAQSSNEPTGVALQILLERRLDNTIYRAGFAMTRMQARQMVGHGLFLVNGRRTDCPSFQVRPGEVIEVRPRSATSPLFAANLQATEKYNPPDWLRADPSRLRIEILSLPLEAHCEHGIDIQKVVEYNSR